MPTEPLQNLCYQHQGPNVSHRWLRLEHQTSTSSSRVVDEQDKKRVVVHILHARLIGAEREEWNSDDIVFPCFTLNFHSFTLLPHFQIFFCTLIHNYLTKLLVEPFNWYSNLIVPRSPDKVGAILPWYVLPYLPHLLLHESSRSAPPGIEWMGITQICSFSFCISLAKFSFRFDLSRPGVKWMGRGRVSSFFHLERWRIGEVLLHAMDVGKTEQIAGFVQQDLLWKTATTLVVGSCPYKKVTNWGHSPFPIP